MKEEFITFETAKLAKEKGFNIPVLEYICIHGVFQCINESTYYEEGDGYRCLNNLGGPILQDYNNIEIDSDYAGQGPCFYDGQDRSIYSAPTQSLLQRWLREKHKINISMISGSNATNLWYSEISTAYKYPIKSDGSKIFTYEEALEDALIKALNLIITK